MVKTLFIFILILGPLQWFRLADVGLNLKPVHLPFFLLGGLGWLYWCVGKVPFSILRPAIPFAFFYSLYLFVLLISSVVNAQGIIVVVKYALYFAFACGVYLAMATLPRYEFYRTGVLGATLSLVVFSVVAYITLLVRGYDLFSIISSGIASGDVTSLQFIIFRNLFNSEDVTGDDAQGVALRHTLLGFIYIACLLTLAYSFRLKRSLLFFTLSMLIILLSVSRSQIVAISIALLPALVVVWRAKPLLMLMSLLLLMFGAGVAALSANFSGVGEIIDQRFGALGEDGRVEMYRVAISEINKSMLFGYGPGHEIDHSGDKTHQVHNLFLGAWMQGGVVCLIVAISFTSYLIYFYVRKIVTKDVEKTILAGLLVLPIFRSQISGGGGNYTLPELLCILLVFLLVSSDREGEQVRKNRSA